MKYIFCLLFLSCAIDVDSNYISTFGTSYTLDVITWNIENFPKTELTVDYLVDIITNINVDVIAIQEIEDEVAFNLLVNLLGPNWDGYISNSSYYGNLGYLINSETVSIVSPPGIILEEYENIFVYRMPYMLEFIFNEKQFIVINNHFKCCGDGVISEDDYWDEEFRRLQASSLLKEYVSGHLSEEKVIILGDLNDEITDSTSDNVFIDFLSSALFYFTDFDIAHGPSDNWSYPDWPSHIDHIIINNPLFDSFYHSNSHVSTLMIDESIIGGWEKYNAEISDHRPVGLKLYITD